MTGRSRLLGLMARRESAAIVRAQAEVLHLSRSRAETAQVIERLHAMLAERAGPGAQPVLAAAFRQERTLCGDIAAEGLRQRERLTALQAEEAAARAGLARKDHRRRLLEEARDTARTAEAEAREARAALATAPRLRG